MTSQINATREDYEKGEAKTDINSDVNGGDTAINVNVNVNNNPADKVNVNNNPADNVNVNNNPADNVNVNNNPADNVNVNNNPADNINVNNDPADYHAGGDSFRSRDRKPIALAKKTKRNKLVSIEKSKLASIEVGGDSSTSDQNETERRETTTTAEKTKQNQDNYSKQDSKITINKVNNTVIPGIETLSIKREKTTRMPTKTEGWQAAAESFGSLQRLPSIDGINAGPNLAIFGLNINLNRTEVNYDNNAEVPGIPGSPGSTRKENPKRRATTRSGLHQRQDSSSSNKVSVNKGHNNSTMSFSSFSEGTGQKISLVVKTSVIVDHVKTKKSFVGDLSKARGSTTRVDQGKAKAKDRDLKMMMEYLPTYRMAPDASERFNHCAVKRVIKSVAEPVLLKFKYSGSEVGPLITKLSNNILKRVKLNFPCRRYRLLCNVYVVHLCGQTVTIADRCVWAKETDNCAVYNHRNRKFACIITLHGIYKE